MIPFSRGIRRNYVDDINVMTNGYDPMADSIPLRLDSQVCQGRNGLDESHCPIEWRNSLRTALDAIEIEAHKRFALDNAKQASRIQKLKEYYRKARFWY